VNTFAGVKKANGARAIYVDEYLEKYVELHADMEQYASEGKEEALDVSLKLEQLEASIDELLEQWDNLRASNSRMQSVEINAEAHAALLTRAEPASQLVSTYVLEVPRALVAQHSPPNLSRHLSSNAPPASMRAKSRAALVST
jgi:hypothetical protein